MSADLDPMASSGEPDPGPRSRRALLAAGLGGAIAWAAGALGHPDEVDAAVGGNARLGRSNSAGSSTTKVTSGGTSTALFGNQTAGGVGVRGESTSGTGVLGTAKASNRIGLRGRNSAASFGGGAGVTAEGGHNHGLVATTANGAADAVRATSTAATFSSGAAINAIAAGNIAIRASTVSGSGAIFAANPKDNGAGILASGSGSSGVGVVGNANGTNGIGLLGNGVFAGVSGISAAASGIGVRGQASGVDADGVAGTALGTGQAVGVRGTASTLALAGVLGTHLAPTGQVSGVVGRSNSSSGVGVVGNATATGASNGVGVSGNSQGSGAGAAGVVGQAQLTGVKGVATSVNGVGVKGENLATTGGRANAGVVGTVGSADAIGVVGSSPATTGAGIGVAGTSVGTTGVGVLGSGLGASGIGVQGSGVIGVSSIGTLTVAGNAQVSGVVSAAAIVAGVKSFRIDHPLDPAGAYLTHACVESDERRNVYDGSVTLDGAGSAVVKLPAWLEALNGDFRYQLTAIGTPMPKLHVAAGVSKGAFRIAGGAPDGEVCWQLTGTRRDACAKANPVQVEAQKRGPEKGRYLHPEAFGVNPTEGIGALTMPAAPAD